MLKTMEMAGPALSESDLAAAERRLGVRLPAAYRAFLLRHNGGRPDPYHYPVPGWGKGIGILNDFDGLVPGAYNDLEAHAASLRDRLPPGLLPIADDPGGNALLLGVAGDVDGQLFLWDHEEQPDTPCPSARDCPNIHFVAPDFDAFLALLR